MFVPIGDSPNFRSTPWVTYTLMALNVAVFILLWPGSFRAADPTDPAAAAYRQVIAVEQGVAVSQVSAYDAVVFRHGFKPGAPRLLDMFTSMFLHGGWMHLFGNMLFLWIYGDNVEHRLGRLGYLVAYLATGLAAAWGDALLRPDSLIPAVGASGAISGVLGFYFIWFPKNRVRVWVFLFPLFMNVVELPARVVLGIYLVLDNILPALLSGGEGGVAYGAHLGGFAAAVAAAFVMDRFRLQRPEAELRGTRATGPMQGISAADVFRQRMADGDLTGGLTTLMSMKPSSCARDLESEEILSLGRTLESEHHPRAALAVYQRLLGEHPNRSTRAAARVGAARVLLDELSMPAAAYQQLVLALEMNPPAEIAAEAREMILRIRQLAGSVPRRWQ